MHDHPRLHVRDPEIILLLAPIAHLLDALDSALLGSSRLSKPACASSS